MKNSQITLLALLGVGALLLGALFYFGRKEADPETPNPGKDPERLNSSGDFFSRAKSELKSGNIKAALKDFEESTKRDPGFFPAWVSQAEIHSQEGDLSKAEACYSKAIEVEPKSAPALANRATLRISLGRPDEGLKDLDQAIVAEPDFVFARMARGLLLSDRGNLDLAISDFDAAIKADSALADGYLARGLAKKAKGDLEGAEKDIRKAATLKPSEFTMQANLALILAKRGNKAESEQAMSDAAKINPHREKALRANVEKEKK